MRNSEDIIARALAVLEAVLADGGESSVAQIARAMDRPVATVHRHVSALVRAGYLIPSEYGRHIAGPRLRALAGGLDEAHILGRIATPILNALAKRLRCIVQMGSFEQDMVTYRVKAGQDAGTLFTRTGMQLEAYCSGMGKVLLAGLPEEERERYLAGGPFIALTPNTVTDPALLRAELDRVRAQDFAEDREEVVAGLRCLAVPLRDPAGRVVAAVSASRATSRPARLDNEAIVDALRDAAETISARMWPAA